MRELLELSAIVRGRVQGVGFRATAKRLADQLKLTGFVRNLPDGSVEIFAHGERMELEIFLAKLRGEFEAEFQVEYHPAKNTFHNFKILH